MVFDRALGSGSAPGRGRRRSGRGRSARVGRRRARRAARREPSAGLVLVGNLARLRLPERKEPVIFPAGSGRAVTPHCGIWSRSTLSLSRGGARSEPQESERRAPAPQEQLFRSRFSSVWVGTGALEPSERLEGERSQSAVARLLSPSRRGEGRTTGTRRRRPFRPWPKKAGTSDRRPALVLRGRRFRLWAASVLALQLGNTTLEASDLKLGAHAAPAERSRHGEFAVELLKLPECGVELRVGSRIHRGRTLGFGTPNTEASVVWCLVGGS